MNESLALTRKISLTDGQLKKSYAFTSSKLQQYQKMANKYKNYVNELAPKIQGICDKENYRTYLKQQKLNSIKSHLALKKIQLQKKIEEKKDPTKSSNGQLHIQILSLSKLEQNYRQMQQTLCRNVRQRTQEIQYLEESINQQKITRKKQLKQGLQYQQERQSIILPKLIRNLSDSSFLTRQSTMSYLSKSRESILSKLNQTTEQKMNQKINQEEEKLILLRLLGIYARTQLAQDACNMKIGIIQEFQRQIEIKTQLIEEIKILMLSK